jgi:hypothetical protein
MTSRKEKPVNKLVCPEIVFFELLFDPSESQTMFRDRVPKDTYYKVSGTIERNRYVTRTDTDGFLNELLLGLKVQHAITPKILLCSNDEIVFRLTLLDIGDRLRENGIAVVNMPAWFPPAWRGQNEV